MRRIRIATYNIHKCQGLDGRTRPARIAEVLRQIDADVVALQEVLCISGDVKEHDQARFLSDELELHFAIGENRKLRGGAYGNVVLSRFPLRSQCNFDITVAGREERGCLRTDVDLWDSHVLHVFNVHLGTAFLERREQARRLIETGLIKKNDEVAGHRIVLGDFNEWTRGLASRMLTQEFESADIRQHLRFARTYPGVLPFLHLDHIYYDATLRVEQVLLHRTPQALIASDHLPLVADFVVNEAEPTILMK